MAPALYSAGGGKDGMTLLRRILKQCSTILNDGPSKSLLMVTELPNIEDSCGLLQSFLPKAAKIRVAYIESDVELSEDYSREREVEAGYNVAGRDWNTSGAIRNRALALISIWRSETPDHGLFCFKKETVDDAAPTSDADEEDQFLTTEGIEFAREHLL